MKQNYSYDFRGKKKQCRGRKPLTLCLMYEKSK